MTVKDSMATEDFMKSLETLEKLAHGETGSPAVVNPGADTGDQGKGPDKSMDDEVFCEPDEVLKKSDPDDDDMGDEEDKDGTEEDTEKSFSEAASENSETIQKAIEVSDFLADLVGEIGTAIDSIRSNVEARLAALEKSIADQMDFNKSLATALRKSFEGTKTLLEKSISDGEELKKSLEGFGNQPAHGRKSRTTVLEKSFTANGEGKEKLSKAQILDRLTQAALGDGRINGAFVGAQDVMKFEMNSFLRPDLEKALGL